MIKIINLSKKFSATTLNFPNLEIYKNELVGLLGPSGSGKTTLLRIIAGLEQAGQGKVILESQVVSDPKIIVAPSKRRVGLVFQDLALWPHLSARQHLEFVLRSRAGKVEGGGWRVENRVFELAQIVKFPLKFLAKYPHQLSGGEKQRLAIARTLAQNPKILLLDEPFNNLDEQLREELKQQLKKVHRVMGLTTIYVTHHREELLNLVNRTIRL